MTTMSMVQRTRSPLRTFVLPAKAWADEYAKRPGQDLAVGLRILPEHDIQTIKREAIGYALKMYSGEDGRPIDLATMIDAYNDALVRWIGGRCCCDPNDVTKSFFEMEEETVRRGLSSDGARFIYDEYDRFRREESPTTPPATLDDLGTLAGLLTDGVSIERLSTSRKLATLKLLRGILVELIEADPAYRPPSDGPFLDTPAQEYELDG